MIYPGGQPTRRALVQASAAPVNGIDYLEVLGPIGGGTQLSITFLKDATSLPLTRENIVITGDDPVPVAATHVTPATAPDPKVIVVDLNRTGGFAPYTLTLVAGTSGSPGIPDPPDGIDPVLSSVTFSFKAGCPSHADCRPAVTPPSAPPAPPDINYLARDYDGLRQVMLDRLAVLVPDWTERHAADLGVVLTETLAYAADHLSYAQDAVGTESYLGTARSRISLRRHARLVDYRVGEGCNARMLVTIATTADSQLLPAGTLFYPATPGLPAALTGAAASSLFPGTVPAFAALRDATVHAEQNAIPFYTWGDDNFTLPAGATGATLAGHRASLRPGDVLVFEEVLGPGTGVPGDADPAHRCAVLLDDVRLAADPLTGDPVTWINWKAADAPRFPFHLSVTLGGTVIAGVSVARGNVVFADHGTWIDGEELPPVPASEPYYPRLASSPLTFSVPFTDFASATAFLAPDTRLAAPAIILTGGGTTWAPEPDLLTSTGADPRFVPEIEREGSVCLRFGDGQHGARPDPGQKLTARYRVGSGTAGNVGRDALGHAVLAPPVPPGTPFPVHVITGVRNPLPVTSGVDPEPMEHIRRFAPYAFQTQARCVTEDDYGLQAALLPGVHQARGTLRWTGSWYTSFVSVDPDAAAPGVSEPMDRLRMLGTDVATEAAIIVGLRIELAICVAAGYFQSDVYAALMTRFTGSDGILDPAGFTFGQTIYASRLVATAQAVEGVASVTLTTLSRLDRPWVDGAADGFITLGRLEIPRCDNDPDHLDHGLFTLTMDGGK